MRPSFTDLLTGFVIVFGCTLLLGYSAREMGRNEGRREVSADLFEKVPKWAASCRLYPDGSKVCRPTATLMERSRREWVWQENTQRRMAKVEKR